MNKMLWMIWPLALAALLALAAAGCNAHYNPENMLGLGPYNEDFFPPEDSTPIIQTNQNVAKTLADRIHASMPPHSTIYIAPFVNQANQDPNSLFGRVIAEQLAASLAQLDVLVVDASGQGLPVTAGARPSAPLLDADGDVLPLDEQPPREARINGAFTPAENEVYLTAQVVDMGDNTAVAGVSWTLPSNKNTRELLPELRRDGMSPNVKTSLDGRPSVYGDMEDRPPENFTPQNSEINILSN